MARWVCVLLAALIFAQSLLAAADAHVLHDISGENVHEYAVPGPGQPAQDHTEQVCHHGCHNHAYKFLSAVIRLAPSAILSSVNIEVCALYQSPAIGLDSPPPIA